MKIFKNLTLCVLSLIFILSAGLTLTACGRKEERVMNVQVNPSLEFILDKNDKVISVSANNEDGLYILQQFSDFIGMSAEDAALKFLELSEQYGFVVSQEGNSETITISISGANAKKLFKEVSDKVKAKANKLGVTVANLVQIAKTELQDMVAQCYQEMSETQIEEYSQEELINLLKISREETKDILSLDEKHNYYRERAFELITAKVDAINKYFTENDSFMSLLITPIMSALTNAYNNLKNVYEKEIAPAMQSLYNSADGINNTMQDYISLKKSYLDTVKEYNKALALNLDEDPNNDVDLTLYIERMQDMKNQALTAYNELQTKRSEAYEDLKTMLSTKISQLIVTINTGIDGLINHINALAGEITLNVQTQINALKEEYKQNSINPWED